MSKGIISKNRCKKYLMCFLIAISMFVFKYNVKAYVGCRGDVCKGYSGVRCYPNNVRNDLGSNTYCELSVKKVSYGNYIQYGIGTYPKYLFDPITGNGQIGFCVQHNNAAPIKDSKCYLKYYDGFSKPALAGLGRILVDSNATKIKYSDLTNESAAIAYVNIQSAQNDLLKKLEVPGYRYNSLIGMAPGLLNSGLKDAFDYYYYTAENSSFVALRPEKMDNAEANVASGTEPYKIYIVLPEYQYKGITGSVSYYGYTVSFTTKSNKKYSSTCGATCTNDSNSQKSSIFSCFKSASGDFCILNITSDLKNDLKNEKVTLNIDMYKGFNIAKLYDCGGGYQDLTLANTHSETKHKIASTTIKFSPNETPVDSCQTAFEKITDYQNLTERAKIYYDNGSKYNNLFNLNYERGDGELACSSRTCSEQKSEASCLSYSKIDADKDFSCYSDISYEPNGTFNYICKTDFNLENNLDTTNFNIVSGMKIPGTDDAIATATLRKLCSSSRDGVQIKHNFDVINEIKFNNVSLKQVIKKTSEENQYEGVETSNLEVKDTLNKGNKIYNYLYEFYAPNGILLEKGTGKKLDELSDAEKSTYNTFYAKNGIYSEFQNVEYGYIPFKISFNSNNNSAGANSNSRSYLADYSTESESNESKKCTYQISEGLIKPKELNLEFRVIDTANPFVDKYGNKRKTMTNWCYNSNRFNTTAYNNRVPGQETLDSLDIQKYYVNKNQIIANDFYKDGVINNIDSEVMNAKAAEKEAITSCSSNNNVVKGAIKNRPNSYGLNSNNEKYEPKYTITLTPQLMNDITTYAKNNNLTYDSFNLECTDNDAKLCVDTTKIEDRNYQTSKLVSFLKDNDKLTINYSTKRKLK